MDIATIAKQKYHGRFPQQQLPMSRKNKIWRAAHLEWADNRTFFNYGPVRNSSIHKKINYDLFNGILHMDDLEAIINPNNIKEKDEPAQIQHYPIINSKLQVLRGEESRRVFDYRVIVTNPNSISEIENNKRDAVLQQLRQLIESQSESEEDFNNKLDKMGEFFTYEWQDMREVRANNLLNHYIKEYNIPLIFNDGFMDAAIVGEEIYQIDIRGGEPVIEKLNPLKVRVFRSGYSNKIEDADVIIIEDYWSPGKIIDTYYDVLTKKDIDYIESIPDNGYDSASDVDSLGRRDERNEFINAYMVDDKITFGEDEDGKPFYFDPLGLFSGASSDLMPFDTNGNVKVLRVYWKSRRKIKKVKSYDPQTGDEVFDFYPETYAINETLGEEEKIMYINEAWEGTKIGKEIYVNMRPRVVQYNRLSNPSRCHFGIIGSIYNINEGKPYSMVDMMKPYNYWYDVIHDRLNKLMAKNRGKLVRLDLAQVPKGWTIDKWLYFAEKNNLLVSDSFNEGTGIATGRLYGGMNTNNNGVVDAELGNSIQMHINLLEFIKLSMSELVGITKQREGQISNRETVGGVERATLQSSHITEWIFIQHDDVKKRALECLLETAKISIKGRTKKFMNILSDGSERVSEIDGDEFAEADYGLVVDNSNALQDLMQKLDGLAQAALQNNLISFSTMMKLYNSSSLVEKQRMVERDEKQRMEQQAQQLQAEQQQQQQQLEANMALKQAELEQADRLNQRDNETKLLIANLQHDSDDGIIEPEYSQEAKDKLAESIRQFDKRLELDKERLAFDKQKARTDARLKEKQINKKTTSK